MRHVLATSAFVLAALFMRDARATSITLDPIKGQTLAVWAAKPDRTVTDIHLLAGDHGIVRLQGLSNLYIHGDGPKTILHRTWVIQSPDIKFQWVHFEGLKGADTSSQNALFFSDVSSPHLTVDSSTFDGAPLATTAFWSNDDWLMLPYGQLVYSNSDSAMFTNNNLGVTYTVMSINGNGWTVARNKLHDFVNDGMDIRGSNISIHDNHIFDLRGVSKQHQDGIQGMAATPTTAQPYTNVSIIGNHIDAGTKSEAPMQGISAFDGKWKNVTITGNYVRPRAFHGIKWSGVTGIVIDGNTVDQFRDARGNPIVHYPDLPPPWIDVSSAKDKTPSTNLTIGRNITPRYSGDSIAAMRPRPSPVRSLP